MMQLIVAFRNFAKAPKNVLRHDFGSSLILVSLSTEIEAYYWICYASRLFLSSKEF